MVSGRGWGGKRKTMTRMGWGRLGVEEVMKNRLGDELKLE